jgi:hypothetical protein
MEFEFKGYSEADQGQYHKNASLVQKNKHLCHGLYMIFTGSKSSSWEVALKKIRQKNLVLLM